MSQVLNVIVKSVSLLCPSADKAHLPEAGSTTLQYRILVLGKSKTCPSF